MPHVMRGIMNDVDMREANHPDDDKPERHREEALQDDAGARVGERRELGGVRSLQAGLQKLPSDFSRADCA